MSLIQDNEMQLDYVVPYNVRLSASGKKVTYNHLFLSLPPSRPSSFWSAMKQWVVRQRSSSSSPCSGGLERPGRRSCSTEPWLPPHDQGQNSCWWPWVLWALEGWEGLGNGVISGIGLIPHSDTFKASKMEKLFLSIVLGFFFILPLVEWTCRLGVVKPRVPRLLTAATLNWYQRPGRMSVSLAPCSVVYEKSIKG